MLEKLRIVLVEPSHPGNIGAAARAMKNMGLEQLYLVNPKLFPHADATARASGADDILAKAEVCESLDQALAGCGLVVGASARLRRLSIPQWNPRECAEKIWAEDASSETAIVFGREHAGLHGSDSHSDGGRASAESEWQGGPAAIGIPAKRINAGGSPG